MRRILICIFLVSLLISQSYCEEKVLKVIELSWTLPQEHIDFIERNRSEGSTYTIDDIRNVIIINDISERAEFIESYIRQKDLSSRTSKVVDETLPVFLELKVDNGEKLHIEEELSSGKSWTFDRTHALVYSSRKDGEDKYTVNMLGMKVNLWFEKISEHRAIVRLDIFYDYVMGWNKSKEPIIDSTMKTLDFIVYLGDRKKIKDISFGNRVIDCDFELGYNVLIYEENGR